MNIRNMSLKQIRRFASQNDDLMEYVESHEHGKNNKPQRGGKRFVPVELIGDEPRANWLIEA